MGDLDWYQARAAEIGPHVFLPLTAGPGVVVNDSTVPDVVAKLSAPAAVHFHFTPGDATAYDITLVRLRQNELLVVLANCGRGCGIVPLGHNHPGYVAHKLGINDAITAYAVTALVWRAAEVLHDLTGDPHAGT